MNEGDFENVDLPEMEVVDTPSEPEEIDVPGQIKALETEIEALELQYNESNAPRIDALKRQKAELEAKM